MPADTVVQHDRRRSLALLMFAVLLFSYALNAMDRLVFPLLLPNVRKEYGFSISDAGLLSTIFTLGLACAGVPTGYLLSKLSRKSVVLIGILIFSAGTAATVLAHGFADMLIYRALTGIGEAMQVTVLIAIASNYFAEHRSSAVGTLGFTYGIGAIIGPILTSNLLSLNGDWRVPILVFGALGLVAMALIMLTVKPWFSEVVDQDKENVAAATEGKFLNHNICVLICLSVLWGLTLYAFFGLYPTFLRESLGYTPAQASYIMSFFGVGTLGSIAGGWVGDRLSPRLILTGCFLISAVLSYLLFLGTFGQGMLSLIAFVWGVIGAGAIFTNLIAYHVKALPLRLSSRGAGLFVTTFYGAASVSGYLLGYLVSSFGWQTASHIQFIGISLIAALVSLFIRPDEMAR
jgi:DHA1 family inner membrane transport protein